MNKVIIEQSTQHIEPLACPINFNWADNPDIQNLLDAISSIIADEYIEIAKQNPDVFSNNGGQK